jgi:hypothetical protein
MTAVGRWNPDEVRERVLDGLWPEPLGGLVLIPPESVVAGGFAGQASTNTAGSVSFTNCSSVSLNGVFSTEFTNYAIATRLVGTSNTLVQFRMRRNNSDDSSTSSYITQSLIASGSNLTADRQTNTLGNMGYILGVSTINTGIFGSIYGPYLSQPTALRFDTVNGLSNAGIEYSSVLHNSSVPQDGISIIMNSGTFSGQVSLYGVVGSE